MRDRPGLRNGRPIPLGPMMEHVRLIERMAKTNGVDLAGAMNAGRLTSDHWSEMVTRCRGCDWVEGCERWLSRHTESDGAPAPCENARILNALRPEPAEG